MSRLRRLAGAYFVTHGTVEEVGTGEVRRGSQVLRAAFDMSRRSPAPILRGSDAGGKSGHEISTISSIERGKTLTRALRSHQLWLTLTYFGLLGLMARGLAG